jgi:hypothetical protein
LNLEAWRKTREQKKTDEERYGSDIWFFLHAKPP